MDEGTNRNRAKNDDDVFVLVKEYICSETLRQRPLLALTAESRLTFPLTTNRVLEFHKSTCKLFAQISTLYRCMDGMMMGGLGRGETREVYTNGHGLMGSVWMDYEWKTGWMDGWMVGWTAQQDMIWSPVCTYTQSYNVLVYPHTSLCLVHSCIHLSIYPSIPLSINSFVHSMSDHSVNWSSIIH